MARFATVPVCSARSPVSGVETLAYEFFSGLRNAGVIRWEEERVQGRRGWTLHLANEIYPFIWDPRLFLVDSDKIASRPGMGDVELFGIKACAASAVPDPLKFGSDLIPRRGTNVLEDDDGRAMIFNPSQHTAESAPGLSVRRNILFLVVQVRIVDARSSSHKYVNVSWNGYLGSICGGTKMRAEK